MQQADACQEISEMNHVAALLRRHGYLHPVTGVQSFLKSRLDFEGALRKVIS